LMYARRDAAAPLGARPLSTTAIPVMLRGSFLAGGCGP
jgi:hypothetical protein